MLISHFMGILILQKILSEYFELIRINEALELFNINILHLNSNVKINKI